MPKASTLRRARRDARQGKKPTTQAGEFVREEMEKFEQGSGNVRSRQQAIAIGLSEARRAGVKLGVPARGKTSTATRKKSAARQRGGLGPTPSIARTIAWRQESGAHPRTPLRPCRCLSAAGWPETGGLGCR